MPTYDYQCQECSHTLEAFHAMSAEPLKDCPACGKPALKRLIGTGAGLLFKGSGFYQTDYRSDSYKKSAEAESSKPSADKKKESTAKPTAADA
ncbi:MAG: FmdB family zinc ribbon protein [Kiritimatiellia bacterium]